MKAKEFDEMFEQGRDISGHIALERAKRSGREQKRVNIDFPVWMIESLDNEARRLGMPRQSVIKLFIAEKLQRNANA